ncbi:MAG: glutamate-1-semialdehyde 2,1-aminomutase [Deltaproteobacteria bacterium]|uniref:Glutamate-1-semialdehyde 2,1-aminomutase n=1 Tax=Candidatus Zymogenus saltonus TaxID=2844893 RepID=A0A9D8PNB9_9DELT|nr:glutamate-1-semialdehyde 2,1-aminomutase [Candidatus Zymogenus saltonus]
MSDRYKESEKFLKRSQEIIPGGVNSPVRAYKSVGGTPPFITRGSGSRIIDADGNEYIDYVLSWGPLILGHAHPAVVDAAVKSVGNGSSFGAPTKIEVEFAEEVLRHFPAMDMIRLVSSGTEAAMTAIRLARGYTGRDKVVKFVGCYHGHVDSLLSDAGSGKATLGIPSTPGVTDAAAKDTITVPFNDLETVNGVFNDVGGQIAAVIVEPVPGNMGVVPPADGFLEGIIDAAKNAGALVIFDEVMNGFRVDYKNGGGGAQTLYKLSPDITLLGKVIGGGFPLGAVAGKKDIMEKLAPSGEIYQAGTLSGNPVAVSAGLATLRELYRPGVFDDIVKKTKGLIEGILSAAKESRVPLWGTAVGTMASVFFTEGPVRNFEDAKEADGGLFKKYFHEMIERGVYLAPSPFEALFVSSAHTDDDIAETVKAAGEVFKFLKNS